MEFGRRGDLGDPFSYKPILTVKTVSAMVMDEFKTKRYTSYQYFTFFYMFEFWGSDLLFGHI